MLKSNGNKKKELFHKCFTINYLTRERELIYEYKIRLHMRVM